MVKNHIVSRLQEVLRNLFDSHHRGTLAAPFNKAQGFADGYMTALCDLGVLSDRELLALVGEERRNAGIRTDSGIAEKWVNETESSPDLERLT